MITNLFSTFDPSTSFISISWTILLLAIIPFSINIWKSGNTIGIIINNIIITFNKEVSYTLNNTEKGTEIIVIIIFATILPLNFLALYPQIFSATAHLTVSLPLSLIVWISIMSFGWVNNTNHILAHLVPQGTPGALINFMVLIELVSNLIRPITLCVRLTANIIAGHLLISLLGNALVSISLTGTAFLLIIPIMLTILEAAVACIQAYVFITLITLYTTEIN